MTAAAQSAPAKTAAYRFNRLLRRLSTNAPPDCHACDVPRAIPQSPEYRRFPGIPARQSRMRHGVRLAGGRELRSCGQRHPAMPLIGAEKAIKAPSNQVQVLIAGKAWRSPNASDIVGAIKSPGKTT